MVVTSGSNQNRSIDDGQNMAAERGSPRLEAAPSSAVHTLSTNPTGSSLGSIYTALGFPDLEDSGRRALIG